MIGQIPTYNAPLENTKIPGFSSIYRNSNYTKSLQCFQDETHTSLLSLFQQAFLHKYSEQPCLGQVSTNKQIVNVLSYKEVFQKSQDLGSGILHQKLISTQLVESIGIYCRNRQQFYLLDISSILYGFATVPFYDTLGDDNLQFCVLHSGITTCLCTTANALKLKQLKDLGNLKTIILLDQTQQTPSLKQAFKVFSFADILQIGRQNRFEYKKIPTNIERCLTLSYTSGTTGRAKAALLSEKNFISALTAYNQHFYAYKVLTHQIHLSVLPLAHLYERVITMAYFMKGTHIINYSGEPTRIIQDLMLVKPTSLVLVPRIYNKFVELILHKAGGQAKLMQIIEENKEELQKLRMIFGGRVNNMLTGSAPILQKYHQLFAKFMGCPFVEAYGQTENTAAGFGMMPNSTSYGTVGIVMPNLQFKLCDLPQMGYTSQDRNANNYLTPRGEVWLRGYGVIKEYYKDEVNTKETFTEDGWLKTGDVAVLLPEGLKIIDRKKNIFKLSQGQYLVSEKIQAIYLRSKFISQCFLYGDSFKDYVVLIAVVNKPQIQAIKQGKSVEQLCNDIQIKKNVLKDLNDMGKQQGLKSFEQAKNIKLQVIPFIERQIVSSTMKMQRFLAKKVYQKAIQDMYNEGMLLSQN